MVNIIVNFLLDHHLHYSFDSFWRAIFRETWIKIEVLNLRLLLFFDIWWPNYILDVTFICRLHTGAFFFKIHHFTNILLLFYRFVAFICRLHTVAFFFKIYHFTNILTLLFYRFICYLKSLRNLILACGIIMLWIEVSELTWIFLEDEVIGTIVIVIISNELNLFLMKISFFLCWLRRSVFFLANSLILQIYF